MPLHRQLPPAPRPARRRLRPRTRQSQAQSRCVTLNRHVQHTSSHDQHSCTLVCNNSAAGDLALHMWHLPSFSHSCRRRPRFRGHQQSTPPQPRCRCRICPCTPATTVRIFDYSVCQGHTLSVSQLLVAFICHLCCISAVLLTFREQRSPSPFCRADDSTLLCL